MEQGVTPNGCPAALESDIQLHHRHARLITSFAACGQVLYIRQPLPDNHTDETFLNELVLNHNVKKRTYWPVNVSCFAVKLICHT